MLKLKNIFRKLSNKFLFLILILLIIVFLFCIFLKNIIVENFGGSTDSAAFDIPTLKKWSFEESKNWYKILKGGYKKNFSELGFTTPNSKLSVLFIILNAHSCPRVEFDLPIICALFEPLFNHK